MNIERNDKKRCVAFVEVKCGTFFEWDNEIYLKINDDYCTEFNAYNCGIDSMTTFGDEAKVTLLNAKVVIE